jgi:hypothetical protein
MKVIQKSKGRCNTRPLPRPARIVVRREFVGGRSMEDALLPVIAEDIRRGMARRNRTLDGGDGEA